MTQPLTNMETLIMVICLAAGIMLTRFIPFFLFAGKEGVPGAVSYLGAVLPKAAMALLLVYCLKDVPIRGAPHGIPELAALVLTGGLQWWLKNTLLSIAAGTIFYMVLVQQVF